MTRPKTDSSSVERDQLTELAALPDEEMDLQDIPEAPAEHWRHALRGVVRLDRDVLKWFREQVGRDYLAEINRVFRPYVSRKK
jgi:uncharacterized protein (DUF4415 family)